MEWPCNKRLLFHSHGRERFNFIYWKIVAEKAKKKFFEQIYFKRKENGNIFLRNLRSVDRYFLLLKMVFISQFNCFSKVVSNDFCNPIKIKAE